MVDCRVNNVCKKRMYYVEYGYVLLEKGGKLNDSWKILFVLVCFLIYVLMKF